MLAFRCWRRWAIRRQSVVSRSCSHACLTRPRTLVFGPALIWLPWKRSDASWEKSWKRRVEEMSAFGDFAAVGRALTPLCCCCCCCCWRSRRAAHQQRRSPFRFSLTREFQMCCSFLSTARGMWGMPGHVRRLRLNLECTLKALNYSISLTAGRVFPEAKPAGNFTDRRQKKHWDTFP